MIGTSRKSFLGQLTGREVDDRVAATIATCVIAYERGARVFRVHDVAPVRDALAVTAATVRARWTTTDEFDEVDEDEGEGHPEPEVTIEISGLSLYTHIGVTRRRARGRAAAAARPPARRRRVRRDRSPTGSRTRSTTPRSATAPNLVAQQRSYKTLERLCAAIADRLLALRRRNAVWVKAAKPEPPIALPVSEVSVEVWREAE